MKWERLLAVIALVGAVAVGSGCKDQSVRNYLGAGGALEAYLKKLGIAVCQLETQQTGLDPAKRLCANGPPDLIPPPTYPPK